jgi:hypothetical protein
MAKTSKTRPSPAPPAAAPPPEPHPGDLFAVEPFLFGILALGIVNGIFSPMTGLLFILNPLWYPTNFLPASPAFVGMFASLIVSTMSIMIAGIPAAIYERFFAKGRTNVFSLWIWIACLAVVSMPAAVRAIGLL